MIEFVQSYGLWIALAGVFVAMHWFGKGCCGGGHRHGTSRDGEQEPTHQTTQGKSVASGTKPGGSCH